MGLFDGRIGRRRRDGPAAGSTAHVAGLLGAPVDPGGRRARPEPQHRRTAARLLDVRHRDPDRRGDPQPGRHRPGTSRCCGRPASRPACRCSARFPRLAELAVPSGIWGWSPPSSTAACAPRGGRDDRSGRRHVDLAAVVARPRAGSPRRLGPGGRSGRGRRRRARDQPWSRWRPARRSPSATPSIAELLRGRGRRSGRVRPARRCSCPTARTRWCCPAVFPSSSPRSSSANDVVRAADPRAGRGRRAGARRMRRA